MIFRFYKDIFFIFKNNFLHLDYKFRSYSSFYCVIATDINLEYEYYRFNGISVMSAYEDEFVFKFPKLRVPLNINYS